MSLQKAMSLRALGMICRANEARELVKHSGLYGEHNEGLLMETLREFLPSDWEVGSGEVIDVDGNHSPQCDVIIYNGRTFPPAHRSKAGKVVVFAHAVGAVIEVKSAIHSAISADGKGDVQALGRQLAELRAFFDAAIAKGSTKIVDEAHEQNIDPSTVRSGVFGGGDSEALAALEDVPLPRDPARLLRSHRIALYGFSYSSVVSAETIASALPAVELSPQVFILDVPRSANVIQEQFSKIVDATRTPTKEALLRFAEQMREPNGYSFEALAFNTGGQATAEVKAIPLGERVLRTFIKELSDAIRRESPLAHHFSAQEAEVIYSAYNPWGGTYEEPTP